MRRVVEPGLFDVMVGGNSVDLTKTILEVGGGLHTMREEGSGGKK